MLIKVVLIVSLIILSSSAECHGKPGPKTVNTYPAWKGTPRFLKMNKYGKLFEVGEGQSIFKLIHVYGDMYQMGLAQGQLLKEEIKQFTTEAWAYLIKQFQDNIPKKIPSFMRQPASGFLLSTALDLTHEVTRPFTNRKYYQEMRGIADGAEISLKILIRIHMIGQLTKGTCSMFGAWGKATPDEKVIQLRSLDWDFQGPFYKYPLITVYHPSSPKFGNVWMNVGFHAWVGVISGVNQKKLGVSEIGVYFHDETFGKQSRFGNPFTFVLRDILQWDKTLDESIKRLQKAKRTCNLILGVGDGNSNNFRGFQYSHSVLNVVNDTHLLPKNQTYHPAMENIVYYGMDWLCPYFHQRLNQMLSEYYGQITAENTMSHILPGLKSGNLQAVVYDLAKEWIYISYGTRKGSIEINAYSRQYVGLNLKQIFSQPIPIIK